MPRCNPLSRRWVFFDSVVWRGVERSCGGVGSFLACVPTPGVLFVKAPAWVLSEKQKGLLWLARTPTNKGENETNAKKCDLALARARDAPRNRRCRSSRRKADTYTLHACPNRGRPATSHRACASSTCPPAQSEHSNRKIASQPAAPTPPRSPNAPPAARTCTTHAPSARSADWPHTSPATRREPPAKAHLRRPNCRELPRIAATWRPPSPTPPQPTTTCTQSQVASTRATCARQSGSTPRSRNRGSTAQRAKKALRRARQVGRTRRHGGAGRRGHA